jgi:Protein of unknown function (DUF3017)
MKHSAKAVARLAREREKLDQPGLDRAQSSWLAMLAYGLVLAGIVAGLAVMRAGGHAVNGGTLVIAGALLAGSLTRLALPDGRAGLLGSRRRLVDVAAMTALGVGLLIAGLIVPT